MGRVNINFRDAAAEFGSRLDLVPPTGATSALLSEHCTVSST